MTDIRLWLAGAGLTFSAWLIVPLLFPSRPPAVAAEDIPITHYVCRESGEVFEQPLTGSPIENPHTGRRTLVPAVYDARRKKWKPGPPLEVMHRQGLLHPRPTE